MIVDRVQKRLGTSAVLTILAVFCLAATLVGLAGSVVMESPVMEHGIAAEKAGKTGGEFWIFAEKSDLHAIRSIISERSRGFSPEVTSLLAEVILDESIRYGLDPALILAIIETESSFRNWSRSNRDARGLMQILPTTGEAVARKIDIAWEGEASLYLPVVNIRVGTYYFSELVARFDNVELALAAYNRGPNAVKRIIGRGRLPSGRYSRKVLSSYRRLRPRFSPHAS
jgi:soluble lytic murein transglycosylase-like protein